MLIHFYLQVCDIIHNSPAFDTMPLNVNEVVVDLGFHKDKEVNTEYRKRTIKKATESGVLTLWKTKDVDLVKASAAMSQWILNTLYL